MGLWDNQAKKMVLSGDKLGMSLYPNFIYNPSQSVASPLVIFLGLVLMMHGGQASDAASDGDINGYKMSSCFLRNVAIKIFNSIKYTYTLHTSEIEDTVNPPPNFLIYIEANQTIKFSCLR